MFRKILSLVLVGLLLNIAGAGSVYAETKAEKEISFAERVKAAVTKLGTGSEARIEVKLKDKRKIKGYISQSDAESFFVVDETGAVTKVLYPQVKQAKSKGFSLSEGVKAAIFLGAVIVGLVIIVRLSAGN